MSTAQRNAYTAPRLIRPGCEHRLGCKCDIPFWLRERTEGEIEFESKRQLIGEENSDDA